MSERIIPSTKTTARNGGSGWQMQSHPRVGYFTCRNRCRRKENRTPLALHGAKVGRLGGRRKRWSKPFVTCVLYQEGTIYMQTTTSAQPFFHAEMEKKRKLRKKGREKKRCARARRLFKILEGASPQAQAHSCVWRGVGEEDAFLWEWFFLDASLHLHMRVCPSVCPSVRPYVR